MVLSGGTRTTVSLTRPWQFPLSKHVRPAECPFDGDKLNGSAEKFPDLGWLAVDNHTTVHRYHKLIMPKECWPEKKLCRLGGFLQIQEALSVASYLSARDKQNDLLFAVQIGLSAGQSKGHLHYHLQTPERNGGRLRKTMQFISKLHSSTLVIENNWQWLGVLGGKYAGQCFILPTCSAHLSEEKKRAALSVAISHIVDLYNVRFRSTEGLSPDFSVSLIIRNGMVLYGCYIPTLYHQWGANDKMADIEGWDVILPWPHEVTYGHLFPS